MHATIRKLPCAIFQLALGAWRGKTLRALYFANWLKFLHALHRKTEGVLLRPTGITCLKSAQLRMYLCAKSV